MCRKKSRLFFSNHLREPNIQSCPNKDIQQEHDIDIYPVMAHQEAAYDETDGNGLNEYQRDAGSEAHIHELVMDVCTVRQERAFASTYSAQHHPDNIQTGYQQNAESNDDGSVALSQRLRASVHTVLDDQEAKNIPHRQATGIAHEDFPPTVGIAKYIVDEERNQNTYADKGQLGKHPQAVVSKKDAEHTQCDDTDAGCQAVDTVNQIDGIGNEHHQHHGKRNTDVGGQLVNTQQTIEIVDVQSGYREQGCRQYLNLEFAAIAHPYQVIADTDDVEQCQAGKHTENLRSKMCREQFIGQFTSYHPIGREQTQH